MTMENAIKVPLSERINLRVVVFAVIALMLIGYPLYVFIVASVTHGIVDRGQFVEVDLQRMSNFEMDQSKGTIDSVPPEVRALDGKRVLLEGEIYQPYQSGDQVGGFQLCYSVQQCCFSGPPKVQHFVNVRVAPGKSVQIAQNFVRVIGVLHVKVIQDEGQVKSVFQLDVDSVEKV